jgi:hypothetical protein
MKITKKAGVLAACFLFIVAGAFSQVVYERHTNEVLNFLSRLAQKGVVVFDDNIRPVSKKKIGELLDSVQVKQTTLSETEKKELAFYREEYIDGGRKRILASKTNDFSIDADPIVTASYTKGSGKDIRQTSMGINFWGRAGKRWGYQLSLHDVNLSGKGMDTSYKMLESGAVTGPVLINSYSKLKTQNYVEMRGHISYEFKNGSISAGQDYLLWGYGESGRIVLSDKAPVYPYIRFDYQPLSWLRFNYTHAWLQSYVLDPQRSYPIPPLYDSLRQVDIPKFMASHSFDFTLTSGLNLAVGESIIYTDKLNIGYLIPVLFFKAVDNFNGSRAITRGYNGHFFFQLSSRNQIKNTHLYATLFIDEIKLGSIFDEVKKRNQLGYTVGGSLTDPGGLSYLTIGAEYTRIRPFVYRNFLPGQSYTNADFLLGDWMGNNADRVTGFIKYTPLPKLKLTMRYSHIRKGGQGTLEQQYQQQPQPPFLFDFQQKSDEFIFNTSYEYLHRMVFNLNFRRWDNIKTLNLGLTYGL